MTQKISGSNSSGEPSRGRYLKNRATVRFSDGIARFVITIGGFLTVGSVALVALYLISVVLPLAASGEVERPIDLPGSSALVGIDEYKTAAWSLTDSGQFAVQVIGLKPDPSANIQTFSDPQLPDGEVLACVGSSSGHGVTAFATRSGKIFICQPSFETDFVDPDSIPSNLRNQIYGSPAGTVHAFKDSTIQLSGSDLLRRQTFFLQTLIDPINLVGEVIRDIAVLDGDELLVAALTSTYMHVFRFESSEDMFTGETTYEADGQGSFEFPAGSSPKFVDLTASGRLGYLVAGDGSGFRVDISDLNSISVVERFNLIPDGLEVTALELLLGNRTLIAGASDGSVQAWFISPRLPTDPVTPDGKILVRGHSFQSDSANDAVRAIGVSTRQRLFAWACESGIVYAYSMTSERKVASFGTGLRPTQISFSPKDDAILVNSGGSFQMYGFDPSYAEVSLSSLFAPVHYEQFREPEFSWQSSSGSDETEPKLSLVPLIFGTLKATFYSILFAAPIAILAAIYTSEFMAPKSRMRVKPVIELMASLPSVVLGFMAIIIAPFISESVSVVLAAIFFIPLAVILGSQLLLRLRPEGAVISGAMRIALVSLSMCIGVCFAVLLAPLISLALFGGDIKSWLLAVPGPSSTLDHASGGLFLLVLPFVSFLVVRYLLPLISLPATFHAALQTLVFFFLTISASILISTFIAYVLSLAGFDLRNPLWNFGSIAGAYDQRNALIVGVVMGFAIIPIIYTMADDALASVPGHLRSASLGAGATPWQTTIRIVVPTAMSGLFSALMIGLGRAVGETMIMLMAAGNTPVMDLNIFEGFRTLAANIAVELPEAPKGGTHYRILFLSALVLFSLTFVINTLAEVVKMRFRRRAYQL